MQDGVAQRAVRIEIAILVGLSALAAVPLFAGRYLPFFDYPAHLAVAAALRHRADPATAVATLWDLDLRLVPNCLHYAFTWLGSFVMPIETASRLFIAVFCIAALPASAAFLLRSFGRDWRLAILVVPLTWNRCLWYGFIGFCAALPMSFVALALVERDLRRPSVAREVGLGALVAVLALAHFFVLTVTLGLCVVLLLMHVREIPWRRLLRAAAPLLAGPAIVAPWFVASLGTGPRPPDGALAHLFAARPGMGQYAALMAHWFMDGYMGRIDDVLAVVMLVTLAALMAYARPTPGDAEPARGTRVAPLALSGALVVGYLALPFEIRAPFHWWGMNVRLLPLLFVWLLVAAPPRRVDRVGRLLLAPVTLATVVFLIYVTVDIARTFNGRWGTEGLDDVLARLPKGARVLGLYTDYRQRPHYAHYPFLYASSYAVVRGGGIAAPFVPIPQSWTNPHQVPDHPHAGDAALFRFSRHARGFTHFLVRTCQREERGCVPDPLAGRPDVTTLTERGRWRLYACSSVPCGVSVPAGSKFEDLDSERR